MMKYMKAAAIAAIGMLALAGCQKATQDTAADEAAIAAVNEAWDAANRSGDADGVANTYAEDAIVLPPGARTLVGRAAIREYVAGDIAANQAAGITMTIDEGSIIASSGDTAWQTGTFTVTDASGATLDTGKFLSVLRKKDGKWSLVRDAWNVDSAPQPAAAPAADAAAESPAS